MLYKCSNSNTLYVKTIFENLYFLVYFWRLATSHEHEIFDHISCTQNIHKEINQINIYVVVTDPLVFCSYAICMDLGLQAFAQFVRAVTVFLKFVLQILIWLTYFAMERISSTMCTLLMHRNCKTLENAQIIGTFMCAENFLCILVLDYD